jgi:hypothetical protein
MLRVAFLALAMQLVAGPAAALPLLFYADTNFDGNYDPGEERTGGVGGNGGSTFTFWFDLAPGDDPASVSIDISFLSYDHNFFVFVNSALVVPLDPSNPAAFAPAVTQPWTPNASGLPRLHVALTTTTVDFEGSLTPAATVMTQGLVYAQPTTPPEFVEGQNRITILNPNALGADGVNFTISGTVDPLPAPEPGSLALLVLGLASLSLGTSRFSRSS